MSLDELLKDKEPTPAWKRQRLKLLRIGIGIFVILVAVVTGAILVNSVSEELDKDAAIVEAKNVEMDVEALKHLLEIRQEAQELENEIAKFERSFKEPKGERRIASVTSPSRRPNNITSQVDSSPQVFNYEPGEIFLRVSPKEEPVYIPTGAVFRARLISPIKTSVQRSLVIAETTHEYRMDMKRKIPKSSRLIGSARLNPVLKGVIVEFNTLVLPNGLETRLQGLALSQNALPEIEGLYFSDNLQNYGTALAFGFLSGFADAARDRESTVYGSMPEASVRNQVLSGLSNASFQVAEDILQDIRERAVEYVVVPAGIPVFVVLLQRYNIEGANL